MFAFVALFVSSKCVAFVAFVVAEVTWPTSKPATQQRMVNKRVISCNSCWLNVMRLQRGIVGQTSSKSAGTLCKFGLPSRSCGPANH